MRKDFAGATDGPPLDKRPDPERRDPEGALPQPSPVDGRGRRDAGRRRVRRARARAGRSGAEQFEEITSYNNFYEFGTGKTDPANYAHALTTSPWSIEIDGLVDNPGTYSFEDIVAGQTIEDRIYRLRCVEAWSMVIPWQGFELADLLTRVGVQEGARFVAFETLVRPEEMPGQRRAILDWPYREGLRLDEAMNPLTILATGLYDEPMPNQNGAPIRWWCRGNTASSRSSRSCASA